MPTLSEIRQVVDDWLAARWPTLVSRQETFFANHGRYFQGLWTHTTAPADGAEAAPDNLTSGPTDLAARWPDFLTLPDTLPCALRIDVYESEQGHGWQATIRVRVAGSTYQRTAQVGPQAWRVSIWHKVIETTQEGI